MEQTTECTLDLSGGSTQSDATDDGEARPLLAPLRPEGVLDALRGTVPSERFLPLDKL